MESEINGKLKHFVEKFVLKFENRYGDNTKIIEKFVQLQESSQVSSFDTGVDYGLAIKKRKLQSDKNKANDKIVSHAPTSSMFENYNKDSEERKNLFNQMHFFKWNRTFVRRYLVEAAYKIFCSFEFQICQVTVNGTWQRGITKLAEDGVRRSTNYLLSNPNVDFSTKSIISGVIFGKSEKFTSLSDLGRRVKFNDLIWNTSEVFSKVGLTDKIHYYSKKNGEADTDKYGYRLLLEHDDPEEFVEENPRYVYTYVLNPIDENQNIEQLVNSINEKNPISEPISTTPTNNETIIQHVKSDIIKELDDIEEQNTENIMETVEYVHNNLKEKLKFMADHENNLARIEETLKIQKINVEKKFCEVYTFIDNEFKIIKSDLMSCQYETQQHIIDLEQRFQKFEINMKQEKEDSEMRFKNLNCLIENSLTRMHKQLEAYQKETIDNIGNLENNVKIMKYEEINFT